MMIVHFKKIRHFLLVGLDILFFVPYIMAIGRNIMENTAESRKKSKKSHELLVFLAKKELFDRWKERAL